MPLAQQAAPRRPIPTDPATLVRINAGAQILAAAALATGRAPRLSATVLAASLVPDHPRRPRASGTRPTPRPRRTSACSSSRTPPSSAACSSPAVDTEGKPGLAWRARRAAADVRREAKQVAKDARREAKLAKAQLT